MERLGHMICEARFDNDASGFRQFLAPDVVYRLIGHRDCSPFAGTFVGADAAIAGIQRLSIEFNTECLKADRMIIDGDQLVIRWSGRCRNRGTNASAKIEGIAHLEIADSLIKRYTNFIDTALIADISGWES